MTKKEEIKKGIILAMPQTIVSFDGNPRGQYLYIEQREEIAEALYNAGYRKTVWHKVADGDLPVSGQVVRVVLEWLGVMYYAQGVHTEGCGWTFADNPNADASVIAWAELPEYKEE